jgi:hypothetical protein
LAACAKSLHGPIMAGPVSGKVSRGESLPGAFNSESLDLRMRRYVEIKTADFDQDGDLDLLTHSFSTIPKIFWNSGNGQFDNFTVLEALGKPSEILVADFDADGDPDLVTQDWPDGVHLTLNDGSAGFRRLEDLDRIGESVRHLIAADWDGQAGVELIYFLAEPAGIYCASFIDGNWAIRLLAPNWSTGFFDTIAVTDVNLDDRPDLVLIGSDMMLLQLEDGSLRRDPLEVEGQSILAAGDYNEDGRADLLVGRRDAPLTIMCQSESGQWEEQGSFPMYGTLPFHQINVQIADLNGDGRDDLCIQQTGFYNMGCWDSQAGWESPSTWQVLLRSFDGWLFREGNIVDDDVIYPGVIARIDPGPYPDLVVEDENVPGYHLIRDPFRP